jgi:hypothetical protein
MSLRGGACDVRLTEQDEISHGLVHGSAKHARVEVTVGTVDADLVVVDTAKTVCQAGVGGVEPVVV